MGFKMVRYSLYLFLSVVDFVKFAANWNHCPKKKEIIDGHVLRVFVVCLEGEERKAL